jgi:hypothetical protein
MSKKGSTKSSRKGQARRSDNGAPGLTSRGNGKQTGQSARTVPAAGSTPLQRLAGETEEEREKRLAARRALTLRAFQTTYENRHRRKTS